MSDDDMSDDDMSDDMPDDMSDDAQADWEEALVEAHDTQLIVRVWREDLSDGWWDGFIAAVGETLFVMQVLDDGNRLDGYLVLRLEDITKVESPAPHVAFQEDNLAMLGMQPVPLEGIPLASFAEALTWIATLTDLVVIHPEVSEPGLCYVGRPVRIDNGMLTLLEIDPDASFEDESDTHALKDITRVDFGGSYARALERVAWSSGSAMPGFGTRWKAAYALVGTHLLDVALGDDTFELSVQLFERAGSPGRYRATVRRSEHFRMMPSFPQAQDGQPQHLTDTLVWHDWSHYLDLQTESFPAYDADHALHLVLSSIDRALAKAFGS